MSTGDAGQREPDAVGRRGEPGGRVGEPSEVESPVGGPGREEKERESGGRRPQGITP